MDFQKRIVTIAGVSGKLGKAIVHHLLSDPTVHVNGLTRDPESARPDLKDNPRITLFPNSTPSDTESLRPACKGAGIIICTYLGSPDFERNAQIALIDAGIAEGVGRYVASDFTVDFRKVSHDEMPQKAANRAVSEYLEEHSDRITGIHVLNGAFMESLFSYGYFWFGPADGIKYWGTGDEIWELITYDTTGAYTAAVALDDARSGWLNFLGDRKSTREIKGIMDQTYSTNVPAHCVGTFKELVQQFETGYKKAPEDQGFDTWKRASYLVNMTSSRTYLDQPLDNNRYPQIQPVNLEQWLQGKPIEALAKTAWF